MNDRIRVLPIVLCLTAFAGCGPTPPAAHPSHEEPRSADVVSIDATPRLASDTPDRVTFGVVLIRHRETEGMADPAARAREDARLLAGALVEVAERDFRAAVRRGDPGSTEDAGSMYRNILEPDFEAVLFGLEPGAVGGPIDTPRGYVVVKRLE